MASLWAARGAASWSVFSGYEPQLDQRIDTFGVIQLGDVLYRPGADLSFYNIAGLEGHRGDRIEHAYTEIFPPFMVI